MKNILFIVSGLHSGGAERQLLNLLKGLNKNEFNVSLIIMSHKGERVKEAMNIGVKVYFIIRRWRWDLTPINKIKEIIKSNNISIVHAWGFMPAFYTFITRFCMSYIWINASIRASSQKFTFEMFLRKMLLYPANYNIANSYAGLKAFGLNPSNNNLVIYSGITQKKTNLSIELIKKKYKIKYSIVISSIGRLHKSKDFFSFLLNAKALIEYNNDICFIIVGNGSQYEELVNYAKHLNISEHVIFTGFIQNTNEILKVTDIFVLLAYAHRGEGFANAIAEAMLQGIPVIASNNGGTPEFIKNQSNGFLFEPGDNNLIVKKIKELLSNKKLSKMIAQNAKTTIENEFSITKMIDQYEQFYNLIYPKSL